MAIVEILDKFSEQGGLIGLIILALFALVGLLVIQLVRINNRLMDLKSSMYKAGTLPDRRGGIR